MQGNDFNCITLINNFIIHRSETIILSFLREDSEPRWEESIQVDFDSEEEDEPSASWESGIASICIIIVFLYYIIITKIIPHYPLEQTRDIFDGLKYIF